MTEVINSSWTEREIVLSTEMIEKGCALLESHISNFFFLLLSTCLCPAKLTSLVRANICYALSSSVGRYTLPVYLAQPDCSS